jgi:hypothetical protein
MESDSSYQSAREGWVYCIVNFRDRDHVKIGMTTRPMENRMKEANGTFMVDGFYIVIAKFVRNPYDREQTIHNILAEHRVTESREFFDVRRPGVFRRILQLFDLMDGDVHADSKLRLDYAPRRARTGTEDDYSAGSASKRAKLSEFSRTFWELFRRTEDAKRTVAVDVVEQVLSERGFGDVTVDMQNLGFYPYEDARHRMVYRGLERAVGTLDLSVFRYTGDCENPE